VSAEFSISTDGVKWNTISDTLSYSSGIIEHNTILEFLWESGTYQVRCSITNDFDISANSSIGNLELKVPPKVTLEDVSYYHEGQTIITCGYNDKGEIWIRGDNLTSEFSKN
jgi:hypothetical protein